MRTTASVVLCLLLTHLLLPMVPVSANLVDAGQTESMSEKVVAWEQMNDGKIMMVTGSGMLSVNNFEAGTHSVVWELDLNVTANSATIDDGENLVAIAHNSGVVIVQMQQQVIMQYLNTSNPVNAVDWDNDGDMWLGYFAGQRRADEWSGGVPSGISTNAHSGGMNTMLITPSGEILTGGYDNRVKITSNAGTLIQQLTDMTSAVNVIALDADGRLLVGTAGSDFYRYNLSDYTYEVMTLSSTAQIVYLKQMDFATYHVGTQSGEIIEVSTTTFTEGNTYDTSGKVIGSLKGLNGEIYIVSGFSSSTRVHLFDIDSDGDGVTDALDAFPGDPNETMDSDGDGMGDNEQKELEDEAAARMQLIIIIGVVLVLAIVGGLLFMRRKNGDSMEPKETTPLPQADPIQSAQEMYATTPEPVQPMVAEPTVENQWTDENGHTWRRMSDGSTLWWNGTDWQQV